MSKESKQQRASRLPYATMTSSSLSVLNTASVTPVSHQKQQHQLEHTPVSRPLRLNALPKGEPDDVH
jgi:hypothetical protein